MREQEQKLSYSVMWLQFYLFLILEFWNSRSKIMVLSELDTVFEEKQNDLEFFVNNKLNPYRFSS